MIERGCPIPSLSGISIVHPAATGPINSALRRSGSADGSPVRPRLINELEAALEEPGQLRLVYQPRLALQTGRVVAVEALLRWQHPELGAVAPIDFIPLAEADPLIGRLTDWVLDHAMGFAVTLAAAGQPIRVSANVSPVNLVIGYLVGRLVELLGHHELPPSLLELEFTEGTLIGDDVRTRAQLKQIRQIGIGVAIDDFGAGYSNLGYLRQIPADYIKIDRALIQPVMLDPDSATIARWLIGLSHELGLRVVAEGLETAAMQAALTEMGCDEGQGYHIARPMESADLLDWLNEWRDGSERGVGSAPRPR